MEQIYQEVKFGEFCKKCEYEKLAENEAPCCECLDEPINLYSSKPVYYKEKE